MQFTNLCKNLTVYITSKTVILSTLLEHSEDILGIR